MVGHGHHEPPYKVPPYTEFKIDGIKQLEEVQAALAKRGLKDPWLRNEAWRYHGGFGTRGARARALFFRGMPLGFVLGAGLFAIDKATGSGSHGHGDGHH